MSTRQTSAADYHRAAMEAVDELVAARAALDVAQERLREAMLGAKATPGVTVEQIASIVGMSRRNVYKQLDRM